MSARQHEMFDRPARLRILRAHIIDAGNADSGFGCGRFQCGRCGWESEWLRIENVTEGKRGVPCPKCNDPQTSKREE